MAVKLLLILSLFFLTSGWSFMAQSMGCQEVLAQSNSLSSQSSSRLSRHSNKTRIARSVLFRSFSDPQNLTSGDFYKIKELKDGNVSVIRGDVSGHGLEEANVAKNLIRELKSGQFIDNDYKSPEIVMNKLDNHRRRFADNQSYAVISHAIIDPKKRTLSYSDGGQQGIHIIKTTGKAESLPSTDLPIGLGLTKSSRVSKTVNVERDDLVLMASDGIWEFISPSIKEFTKYLSDLNLQGESPQAVRNHFKKILNNRPMKDDMSLIVLAIP